MRSAARSTGQAGFSSKPNQRHGGGVVEWVINNVKTYSLLSLSLLKKTEFSYIPSLFNVEKVTWPRKKGSKMIVLMRCSADRWVMTDEIILHVMVGHRDLKILITIHCWRWSSAEDICCWISSRRSQHLVWIISEHCTEWSSRDLKRIILGSDYICCERREGCVLRYVCDSATTDSFRNNESPKLQVYFFI